MGELSRLSDLISEQEVYEKYGHLFVANELREARQLGQLRFFPMRKGIFYTEGQLIEYIGKRERCRSENKPLREPESQKGSGNTGINGSNATPRAPISIVAGMTPELEGTVAEALEPQTLRRPRSS